MYYISKSVALPVSGLGIIIRIFNCNIMIQLYSSIWGLWVLVPRGSVYTMGDRFI